MKKKLTALFLALVMCMTLCVPALAANTVTVEPATIYTIHDDVGNEFGFELITNDNNSYTMNYFLNGVLNTVYTFNRNISTISATRTGSLARNSTTYMFDARKFVNEVNGQVCTFAPTAVSETWASLGTIYYSATSDFPGETLTATLQYQLERVSSKRYNFSVVAGDLLSDAIASVVGILIGFFSKNFDAGSIGAEFVKSMLTSAGISFVGGIISANFTDDYNTIYRSILVKATMNHSSADVPVNYYSGTEERIVYNDFMPYEESVVTGITTIRASWANRTFAKAVWDDSFIYYKFPGYYTK